MNISPTPRRYTSRNGDFPEDNLYAYSDPINRNLHDPGRERIVPEEYRLNSQMINRLIRQNKELINKLDSKQEEIDRLNVLVGSLRGKLIKYTELNKKLQEGVRQTSGSSRSSSDDGTESANYIQLPKRRENKVSDKENEYRLSKDDRISALSEKLDMLTKLMMEGKTGPSFASPERVKSSPLVTRDPQIAPSSVPSTAQTVLNRPSEEDIMCRESMELKQLEDQIESLKRKLLIKRENELRKISLNQELLELMGKLSVEQAQANSQATPAPAPLASAQAPSEYCAECHHAKTHTQHHIHNHKDLNRPSVPATNPLETPTPFAKRANLAASTGDLTDTINRIW